jgi:hypothetical protein
MGHSLSFRLTTSANRPAPSLPEMFSNNQPPNQQSDRSTQSRNRERWHPKEHDAQNLAPEATGKEEKRKDHERDNPKQRRKKASAKTPDKAGPTSCFRATKHWPGIDAPGDDHRCHGADSSFDVIHVFDLAADCSPRQVQESSTLSLESRPALCTYFAE